VRRRLSGPLALVVLAVLAGGALASFSTTGAGTAAASITTLSVPGSPAASSGDNVSVTWSASTIAGTVAATSYVVERYTSGGSDLGPASCSPVPASSGTPNAFGSFSCTDSPGAGTYEYKITARYNGSWTAASGFTNTATARNATTTSVGAPGSSTAGVAIASGSISATLAGAGAGAGGTVTFTVFGPQASAPTSCGSGGTQVGSAVSVSGSGTYHPSAGFTPSAAGTYWWYASYGGDANNAASSSTCGSGMTSTVAWTHSSAASATDTTLAHTATTTSSFTVKPSAVYLLLVFRHSSSGDGITSISSTGLSPSLSTSSFTSLNSHTFNTSDYQWAYVLTTGSSASGTGTLTVSFTKALGASQVATLDLVQVQGGSLTTPVVTANEGAATGSSATATANLPSAPAAGDSEVVFLGTSGNAGTTAPTASPAMTNVFYSHQTAGSAGVYSAIGAQQNESLTLGSSQSWGTLSFELAHG
jgi:trimeric autotransporter adhesin